MTLPVVIAWAWQGGDGLDNLGRWVIDVIERLGYVGVFALVALENLVPPIPSEVILPLAGFLIGQGRFAPLWVLLAATAGSVAGALILYGAGRLLGERRLRRLVKRFDWLPFIEEEGVDRAQAWFDRHGGQAVLLGRLVPTVRSVISIPAGLARMPLLPFVAYTTLGSGLWNMVLIGLGWWLGAQWQQASQYVNIIGYIVLGLLLAPILWWLIRRLWQARSQ